MKKQTFLSINILGVYSNPNNLHTCLGTILSTRHVLTAAICVCHPNVNSPFNLFGHNCDKNKKEYPDSNRLCKYLFWSD